MYGRADADVWTSNISTFIHWHLMVLTQVADDAEVNIFQMTDEPINVTDRIRNFLVEDCLALNCNLS